MENTSTALAVVVTGSKGDITLQSVSLPDIRTLVTDEQRKAARSMALAIDLNNTRAIMDFGSQVTMSPIAKAIAANTKVGMMRGTEAEQVLKDLGLLKTKFDPMRVLSPKLQKGFFAAKRFSDAVQAYRQDFEGMDKPMQALEERLTRTKLEEGVSIDQLDGLRNDCMALYDQFTVLEAGYKYLVQRMLKLYDEKKTALVSGDLRAETELSELGDYIGMVDRSTFDTHFARARVIVIAKQIQMMRKADEELYRMFGSQLSTALPVFQIEMAAAIKLVMSQKSLSVLQQFKDAEIKQAADLEKALNTHVVAVATMSEDNTAAVQQLLSSYKGISDLTDQLVAIHQNGAQARAAMTGQINAVVVGMGKKVSDFDPRKMLEAPEDLKDVPLMLESGK